MQGIEFEDNRDFSGISTKVSVQSMKPSLMMKLLAKIGIADKTTANYILLAIAIVGFGLTIFLYADLLSSKTEEIIISDYEAMM